MSHTQHLYASCILLVTVLFLLGAAPLAAGDSHWYVNGQFGQGSLDARFGRNWPGHFEGEDETGSVEVGYILNRHLAVQAGYHDLGEYQGFGPSCFEDDVVCIASGSLANDPRLALCVEGATDEICRIPVPVVLGPMTADISGLSLSLVPRWPLLGDRLTVYGKLGVIDWASDVHGRLAVVARARDVATGPGLGVVESTSDRDLLAGVGVQYNIRKGLGVLVEYQRLDFDHDSTSVGASWRF